MKAIGFYWWWDHETAGWTVVEVVNTLPRTPGRTGLTQEARTTDGRAFNPGREDVELRGPLAPPAPPRATFWDRLREWWQSRQEGS